MKSKLKKTAVYILSKILKPMSASTKAKLLSNLIQSSVKGLSPKERLQTLLELDNQLYSLEGNTAVEYGNGIHTKHKHINYHKFFIENLNSGERVLDIGCGNGCMDYDIVTQVPNVVLVGIDLNKKNIAFANKNYLHNNLKFIQGNALKKLPEGKFDVVILSNVLEHLEQRVEFLKRVIETFKPKRMIIRVPSFERDWRVPLKKELGINYNLDATHCIEYTQEEYFKEIEKAGLKPAHTQFKWGEIWSVARPTDRRGNNA